MHFKTKIFYHKFNIFIAFLETSLPVALRPKVRGLPDAAAGQVHAAASQTVGEEPKQQLRNVAVAVRMLLAVWQSWSAGPQITWSCTGGTPGPDQLFVAPPQSHALGGEHLAAWPANPAHEAQPQEPLHFTWWNSLKGERIKGYAEQPSYLWFVAVQLRWRLQSDSLKCDNSVPEVRPTHQGKTWG